jgi:HSP20 family protein
MNVLRWHRSLLPGLPNLSNLPTLPGFGRLSDLHSELDRLFNSSGSEWPRSSQVSGGRAPALDVYEDKDNYTVKVEAPGVKKEDIDISLHDGVLSISGERKAEEKAENAEVHRTERFVGRFQRTVTLPSPVAADKVQAQYKDGVLTVTLPKTEEAKPKQITIQAG